MKFIKTIETLLNKAENKGQAKINGRMSYGTGMIGTLKKNMQLRLRVTHWL